MAKTLSFDEKTNTWTSFWSYHPEWMARLNRGFFSFKNGQLYKHHSETADRNYFYNDLGSMEVFPSSVTVAFNQNPSDIKQFKTISLESNTKDWNVEVVTNLDSGYIDNENLETREGEHYGYIRRNLNSELDFTHLSIQGIGVCTGIVGDTYYFDSVPSFISTEDNLYYIGIGNNPVIVEKVTSFNSNSITTETPPIHSGILDAFYFVAKNPVAESNGIKGNHATITLTTTDSANEQTLFTVNTEIFKSFQ